MRSGWIFQSNILEDIGLPQSNTFKGVSDFIAHAGYCEDQANNQECNYDEGDCCGDNVNIAICDACICYPHETCSAPLNLIADGYCNDETNNAECNFDGGDCCGLCVNSDHCSNCLCHTESPIDPYCKYSVMPLVS